MHKQRWTLHDDGKAGLLSLSTMYQIKDIFAGSNVFGPNAQIDVSGSQVVTYDVLVNDR